VLLRTFCLAVLMAVRGFVGAGLSEAIREALRVEGHQRHRDQD
jgi:hypothetical protein